MTHGSLFSGIGGFDLAAEWTGWENKFHCEINEFGRLVLKYYWPKAVSYEDIKKTDFTIWRGLIGVLSGGFPCQPYSQAGKRKGKEDERHLWPEMLRAIREIQPGYVVGENVSGLVNWSGGLVFNEVQTDLEAEGYEVTPFLLPACGKDAPHKRERVWFVAYNNGKFNGRKRREKSPANSGREAGKHEQERCEVWNRHTSTSESGIITNCANPGIESLRSEREDTFHGFKPITNTYSRRQSGKEYGQAEPGRIAEKSVPNDWSNFPTQSPLCSRNDGLSTELSGITFSKHRNESIKAYGNAIVPAVALEIFKAIEQCKKLQDEK